MIWEKNEFNDDGEGREGHEMIPGGFGCCVIEEKRKKGILIKSYWSMYSRGYKRIF